MSIIRIKMKYLSNKIIFILTIITIGGLMHSCSNVPSCIKKNMYGVTVDWGEISIDKKTQDKSINGYIMNHLGEIQKYSLIQDSTINHGEPLQVEEALFCRTINFVRQQIVDTQALFEPGQDQKFIRYRNPNFKVDVRVLWNSEFKTGGSKKARAAYDSLSVLIDSIKS